MARILGGDDGEGADEHAVHKTVKLAPGAHGALAAIDAGLVDHRDEHDLLQFPPLAGERARTVYPRHARATGTIVVMEEPLIAADVLAGQVITEIAVNTVRLNLKQLKMPA